MLAMASTTFHVRKITLLGNGSYQVDAAIVYSGSVGSDSPSGTKVGVFSVTLRRGTKFVDRLTNSAFVNEPLETWIAAHGEKWSQDQVSSYLQHILNG
jgi:hypothetical protein